MGWVSSLWKAVWFKDSIFIKFFYLKIKHRESLTKMKNYDSMNFYDTHHTGQEKGFASHRRGSFQVVHPRHKWAISLQMISCSLPLQIIIIMTFSPCIFFLFFFHLHIFSLLRHYRLVLSIFKNMSFRIPLICVFVLSCVCHNLSVEEPRPFDL